MLVLVLQIDRLHVLIFFSKGIYCIVPILWYLIDQISNSGAHNNKKDGITRRDFLKFVGVVGVGIITAPFVGSMSKFIPSYYYSTSSNSQGQHYNDKGPVRSAEATTTSSNDKNGVRYVQPFSTYRLAYSNETWTFTKNFRSDGSMRCDFEDRIRDSVYVGAYFKVKGPDSEEVSAKLNGGPHTSSSPENTYADTMDIGITNFLGTRSRVRWEKTHPNYSSGIAPSSSSLPVGDVRNKWIGFCALKVNLDSNGDGKPDWVGLIGMIDVGGLDPTTMKPRNNWKKTFARNFRPSEIDLKSIWTPYVATIGKSELAQQTIRVDEQSQSEWQSSNPPYKYVTCKQVTATKI
jgi:hypothetical protein